MANLIAYFALEFKSYKKQSILWGFIVLFTVLFPFLNNFRDDVEHFSEIEWNYDFLDTMHFDAFQNMALIKEKVGVTWGETFWAYFEHRPKNILENPPPNHLLGLLKNKLGYNWVNVAVPPLAESYLHWVE